MNKDRKERCHPEQSHTSEDIVSKKGVAGVSYDLVKGCQTDKADKNEQHLYRAGEKEKSPKAIQTADVFIQAIITERLAHYFLCREAYPVTPRSLGHGLIDLAPDCHRCIGEHIILVKLVYQAYYGAMGKLSSCHKVLNNQVLHRGLAIHLLP